MALIDERGRLFGRLNLLDAIILLVVVGLIPLAYAGFVLFRSETPRLLSVAPAQIVEGRETTVQLTGDYLRAFLMAKVGNAPATFLIQSTSRADIKVPPLPPGTYDLVLSDEGTELVRMPSAITVTRSPLRVATVTAQFAAIPELVARLRPGDADLSNPAAASEERAVLSGISDERRVATVVTIFREQQRERGLPYDINQELTAFRATLRMPLVEAGSGWRYLGQPVRIGSPFTFETAVGIIDGWIVDIDVPDDEAGDTASRQN
jgi:hypothetical protein